MRPKDVGTRAESAVVAYLQAQGFAAERRALAGVNDRGDVAWLDRVCVEIKDHGKMELAEWLKEAQREAACRGCAPPGPGCFPVADSAFPCRDLAVVWHKRRGKGSPADWYVTMDGATFAAFLKETGR